MYNIVPPPELRIIVPRYCPYCEAETEHEIIFKAYSYQHHAISYNLYCMECREHEIKENISVDDWLKMLSDISDNRSN